MMWDAGAATADDADPWPGAEWEMVEDIRPAGWSLDHLDRVWAQADRIGTAALMLVQGGRVIASRGDVTRRFLCHSMRKSFLSALIGTHEGDGTIDLSLTLAALGIDDREGLNEREKQATVYDLLTARSGIFHPAGYETAWMKSLKPARHAHAPGTVWCYSNWDFNALGTIYTQLTGLGIHAAFRDRIAAPLGMQDFRFDAEREDGRLVHDPCSVHPAYPFRMSTRDLARFGLLFLRDGRWGDREVVPQGWVAASVLPYSDAGTRGAYGYMWWVARQGIAFPGAIVPEGTYSAQGAGGHVCVVIPPLDLVIVHRADTETIDGTMKGPTIDRFQFGRLLALILDARRAGMAA
ncbi:serine hydrolase domain-containing protein [Inquilinus sp.]|jgi:CubicO group peptidase (beta-lactamase class C family)|uniref:serine hydrolase domain-containing protein n=1 Tax=Inquilinus sp. TaxID=1932117 RepID=UPI00378345D1